MKSFIFLPFVLLLGLIIGGWAPKEELRATKKEVAELTGKLASREKDSRIDPFTRMVQIPERAQKPKPAAAPKPISVHLSASVGSGTNGPITASAAAPTNVASKKKISPETKQSDLKPEDLQARIEEAKELWKTRVEIARAQWIERLKLSPEGIALFDASVNAMNEELYLSMQGLAAALESTDTLTPELGTRFFNEMTTSLVKTYDDLDAFVPEAQRGDASKLELTDFIDPAVAEPLIAVQGKLENMPRQNENRRVPRFFR